MKGLQVSSYLDVGARRQWLASNFGMHRDSPQYRPLNWCCLYSHESLSSMYCVSFGSRGPVAITAPTPQLFQLLFSLLKPLKVLLISADRVCIVFRRFPALLIEILDFRSYTLKFDSKWQDFKLMVSERGANVYNFLRVYYFDHRGNSNGCSRRNSGCS